MASLVREMTFESFQEEVEHLWSRSAEARLLKLYDKVSNLLDGSWMKAQNGISMLSTHLGLLQRLK